MLPDWAESAPRGPSLAKMTWSAEKLLPKTKIAATTRTAAVIAKFLKEVRLIILGSFVRKTFLGGVGLREKSIAQRHDGARGGPFEGATMGPRHVANAGGIGRIDVAHHFDFDVRARGEEKLELLFVGP